MLMQHMGGTNKEYYSIFRSGLLLSHSLPANLPAPRILIANSLKRLFYNRIKSDKSLVYSDLNISQSRGCLEKKKIVIIEETR